MIEPITTLTADEVIINIDGVAQPVINASPVPSIGRIVRVVSGNPSAWNGADVAPAIITRVWTAQMVNLHAWPDMTAEKVMGSVGLYADEASARAILAAIPEEHRANAVAAFWPERG